MNTRVGPVVTFEAKGVLLLSALLLLVIPFHGIFVHEQVMLIAQVIASLCVLVILWSGSYKGRTYPVVLWFFWLSILMTCAYVVPLPFLSAVELPGRELYADVLEWLGARGYEQDNQYLSIIPYQSKVALLALIPPVSLFFAALSLSEAQIFRLVYLLLIIAVIQASLGLIQYASGNLDFYFGIVPNGRSAQGTYLNRDHFSALLEMTLPIAIGLMLFSFGRLKHEGRVHKKGRTFNSTLLFAFFALLIFLAAIFARSRAGVFLIMLGVLISTVVFSRHVGGKQSVGLSVVFSTIAMGIALSIGLIPVLNRFVSKNPIEDERWRIFKHSIEGIQSFFPVGSGPGTFPDIYRVFQPIEQLRFINNAHNDYLELLFELGAVAVFIFSGFFLLYLMGWYKLRRQDWGEMRFLQVASGIGIFLVLLHCSVEFLLHEPMNTMIFAFLLGVFFRKVKIN